MRHYAVLFASAMAFASFGAIAAQASGDNFWTEPAISGYGKMHALPNAAYRPQASETYQIVFALSKGPKSPGEVNPSLDRVARTVNLYVSSGVPLSHLKFVAVAYGDATSLVLNDEQYKAAYGVANPNLPLIEKLRNAGVDIAVCGQAVAEHKYQYEWVDKKVTLALSALTTITTLEHSGYDLLQL